MSHTGFGGVAYAMAILCIRLGAEADFVSNIPQSIANADLYEDGLHAQASEEAAFRLGDYRDILSLTRVLMHGPKSKADVDIVIERYAKNYLWLLPYCVWVCT